MPQPLSHRLGPAFVLGEAQRITRKYWRKATRYDQRVAVLAPSGQGAAAPKGRVLLSYILDPLLAAQSGQEGTSHDHTHFWETLTIARTWQQLGFEVHGISWTNHQFTPKERYDLVIDVRLNLERLAPLLAPLQAQGATPPRLLLHTDTAHWTTHNPAQEARHVRLTNRRGTVLERHRLLPENRAAEVADHISYLGNDAFTGASYNFAETPMTRIPVSVPFTYPWPETKDFEAARHRFLWFGSGGLVHKGLDLVLEAFAEMPELHLTVCGPVRKERDFESLYQRELYGLPNIETLGWIDTSSPEFLRVANSCGALIYPSCSEGGGSSAITCMHAGLVPILTRETSVDIEHDTTGVLLGDDRIESLREAARSLASWQPNRLEQTARAAWEWARAHHTRDHFAACYRRFAEEFLG